MSDLLINEITSAELANFLKNPSHALLLAGPDGSGRLALAKMLASELLGASKLENNTSFTLIEPDAEKGNISIDQIRELKSSALLKSSASAAKASRVIVIASADKMLAPAQNSFLKLLEEPPAGTIIILTALAGGLKPTILSRVQQIKVRPVELALAKNHFSASDEQVKKAYQISGGRLGVMSELLETSEGHPLAEAAKSAREILAGDRYQRLCQVDQLAKDKVKALAILAMLGQMATAALANAKSDAGIRRWQRVLAAALSAETALAANANAKLVLTNLMLEL